MVIEVVEIKTGKVVKTIEVKNKSEGEIDKIEMGLLRNMNIEEYFTRQV